MEDEKKGLELGAVDFLTKPANPPIVLARIKTHLKIKDVADFLRDKNTFLEEEVAKRTRQIQESEEQVLINLATNARDAMPNVRAPFFWRYPHGYKLLQAS